MVMTAGKVMSQFMRQKNCEESDGKGDSAEEKRRMLIGEAKGFKERFEGRGPVVSVSVRKKSPVARTSDFTDGWGRAAS